jgi:quinol monooxygenase YgiN
MVPRRHPDRFFFYENWESEADLDAHLAART